MVSVSVLTPLYVAPDTVPLASGLKVDPPLLLTIHCTLGPGTPLAAAVKVAVWPGVVETLAGWVVIAGGWSISTVVDTPRFSSVTAGESAPGVLPVIRFV